MTGVGYWSHNTMADIDEEQILGDSLTSKLQ